MCVKKCGVLVEIKNTRWRQRSAFFTFFSSSQFLIIKYVMTDNFFLARRFLNLTLRHTNNELHSRWVGRTWNWLVPFLIRSQKFLFSYYRRERHPVCVSIRPKQLAVDVRQDPAGVEAAECVCHTYWHTTPWSVSPPLSPFKEFVLTHSSPIYSVKMRLDRFAQSREWGGGGTTRPGLLIRTNWTLL